MDNDSKPLPDPQDYPNRHAASDPEKSPADSTAKADSSPLPARKASRARDCRPRQLSPKMAAWARFFTDPKSPGFGNKTRSSQLAGYRGRKDSSAWAVQGHRNANHPTVREMIRQGLDDAGATVELGGRRVREGMDATRRKSFLTSAGDIVYSSPEPDHPTRLRATLAMFELRREAESRAQSGAAEPGETLDNGETLTVDGDPQRIASLENRVTEMPEADRMLARHEIGLYRRILKLNEKQAVEAKTEKS